MTYGELSKIKTTSFNLNHIIDDTVSNARFSFGQDWKNERVSRYDLKKLAEWAEKESVVLPLSCAIPSIVPTCEVSCLTDSQYI